MAIGLTSRSGPRLSRRVVLPAERSTPLLQTFAVATAAVGVFELVVARIAAPVASHLPSGNAGLAGALRSLGDAAVGATAVLVAVTASLLARRLWTNVPVVGAGIAAALAATVATASIPSAAMRAGLHLIILVAMIAVLRRALAVRVVGSAAVAVLAAAAAVAQLPLLLTALALGGGAEVTIPVRTAVELSMVLVPVLLVPVIRKEGAASRVAWLAAGAAATVTLAALLAQPEHTAIVALWAVGATLSLPPLLYVVAAGATGFVLGAWLTRPNRLMPAAGLVLLLVAGLQPALIHHNLTALVGLTLIATPILERSAP